MSAIIHPCVTLILGKTANVFLLHTLFRRKTSISSVKSSVCPHHGHSVCLFVLIFVCLLSLFVLLHCVKLWKFHSLPRMANWSRLFKPEFHSVPPRKLGWLFSYFSVNLGVKAVSDGSLQYSWCQRKNPIQNEMAVKLTQGESICYICICVCARTHTFTCACVCYIWRETFFF